MNDLSLPAAGAGRGLWSDARHRLQADRVALSAAGLVVDIGLAAVLGPALSPYTYDGLDWGHLAVLCVAIGAVGWLAMAGIVRAQTLSLKRREFIEAARALGVGTPAIIARHILPNLVGAVAVYATLTIPQMIIFESFLSFLGLG